MNNDTCCVYVHTDVCGNIFYIGSGRENRAFYKELSKHKGRGSKRGKAYSDKVMSLNYNYCVKIIAKGLSKDAAISLEIELYNKMVTEGICLVNHNRPSKAKSITHDQFIDVVYYDKTSISGLRWKAGLEIPGGHRKANTVVGTKMKRGCYQFKFNNVSYLNHRVIAALHGLLVDGLVVDHVNGQPWDNRIENLRVCTDAENSRNRRIQHNNASGVAGVVFNKGKNCWIAILRIPATNRNKEISFSTKKYGYDKARQLAIEARLKMLENAKENGIIYSDRHCEVQDLCYNSEP